MCRDETSVHVFFTETFFSYRTSIFAGFSRGITRREITVSLSLFLLRRMYYPRNYNNAAGHAYRACNIFLVITMKAFISLFLFFVLTLSTFTSSYPFNYAKTQARFYTNESSCEMQFSKCEHCGMRARARVIKYKFIYHARIFLYRIHMNHTRFGILACHYHIAWSTGSERDRYH